MKVPIFLSKEEDYAYNILVKPLTFYILCGNAAYNRGDRVNLTAQIDLIRSTYPNAKILIGSYRAEVDRTWYDAEVRERPLLFSYSFFKDLAEADVVIWGGGALLADNACRSLIPYWYCLILFIRLVLRKSIVVWAHGIVLQTKVGRFVAKRALQLTDAITVRDKNSFKAVERLKISKVPILLTSDPAILIKSANASSGRQVIESLGIVVGSRPIFGIAPTFWPFFHRKEDYLPYVMVYRMRARREAIDARLQRYRRALCELGEELVNRYDAEVIFLPRYPCPPWPDVKYLEEFVRSSSSCLRMHVLTGDEIPPKQYAAIFRHLTLVVSTALHDAIVAATVRTPCIKIHYEEKCQDFQMEIQSPQKEIGLDDFLSPTGPNIVIGEVEQVLHDRDGYLTAIQPGIEELQNRAAMNLKSLAGVVDKFTRKDLLEECIKGSGTNGIKNMRRSLSEVVSVEKRGRSPIGFPEA